MPLRNGQPVTWRPKGLTDAIDGTNSFPGAMASLSNLIPDPTTDGVWVGRPPAISATTFGSFTTPGFISALLVIGTRAYGMIASGRNAGNDEPFVYDLLANTFITVSGITSGNTPVSPSSTGDWTPPIMAQCGSRIIVTHPGFNSTTKFGWFDISGLSQGILGDTVNTSPVITGNPDILGMQPGLAITGSGIPGSTTILFSAAASSAQAVTGTSHTNFLVDGIASTAGIFAGMSWVGPGIPPGTTVNTVAANSVTLSQAAQTSVTAQFVALLSSPSPTGFFTGGFTAASPTITVSDTSNLWVGQIITAGVLLPSNATIVSIVANTSITLDQNATATVTAPFQAIGNVIVMSAAATATANNVALQVTGGTFAAPQWGAGDTQPNNLPIQPVGVAQMNGRAYFACGTSGIPFSDSGFPCQISDNTRTQALTTNDGLAVTAIGPVTLSSLVGGIVQSLIAFEANYKMQQITGDAATNNLSMNALPVATGTLAPLSLAPCELGLAFISPEGMRIVDFIGRVSPPYGDHGQGITTPFIYAVTPSRICGAANSDTIRWTVQNGYKTGNPYEDYWYDIGRKSWHGPHTSTASLLQPYGPDSYAMTFVGTNANLFVQPTVPVLSSTYIENGKQIAGQFMPVGMLPDNAAGVMNMIRDMTIAVGGPSCDPTAPPEPLLYAPPVIGNAPVQPSGTIGGPGTVLPPNQPPPPPGQTPTPVAGTSVGEIQLSGASNTGTTFAGMSNRLTGWAFGRSGGLMQLGQSGGVATVAQRISVDGSIIVGNDGHGNAAWWDTATGTLNSLSAGDAYGISSDNTIIYGRNAASPPRACYWVRSGGAQTLLTDVTSGTNFSASRYSWAISASSDKSIIVGMSRGVACVWVSGSVSALNNPNPGTAGGSVTLWYEPSTSGASAIAISSDGSVIVGQAADGTGLAPQPVYWLTHTGSMTILPLGAGDTHGFAFDVSSDGTRIAGQGSGFTSPPYIWKNFALNSLPLATGVIGGSQGGALCVSGDGSTAGGAQGNDGSGNTFAVWWDIRAL